MASNLLLFIVKDDDKSLIRNSFYVKKILRVL